MDVEWIEHQGTRIVSLAGLAGGVALTFGWEPFADVASTEAGVALAAASAGLHIANRALAAFRKGAGLDKPMRKVTPSS